MSFESLAGFREWLTIRSTELYFGEVGVVECWRVARLLRTL